MVGSSTCVALVFFFYSYELEYTHTPHCQHLLVGHKVFHKFSI